jgi:hypothetical protein
MRLASIHQSFPRPARRTCPRPPRNARAACVESWSWRYPVLDDRKFVQSAGSVRSKVEIPEIFSAIHSEKSLAHFILVACSATLFNQSVGGCGRARVKDARPRLRRPAGPARLSWPEFESACQVLDHHCVRPSTRSRQSAAIMPAGPAATWRSLRSLVEGHLCLSRR